MRAYFIMTQNEFACLINNKRVETEKKRQVLNPFNREPFAEVFFAGEKETELAVQSGLKAFEKTSRMKSHERAELLSKAACLIEKQSDDFARTIALESGKPISAAKIEVSRGISTFKLASEEAIRIHGETLPLDILPQSDSRIGITRRFPRGVILAISPFNFPLNLVAHKVAPALAAGNSVILKPASSTPVTSIKLGEVLLEAGMPPGAVNIIPCPPDLGQKLAEDESIKMLSFTGSPEVGWKLKKVCGRKVVSLELGGNAGVIVEPDCDIDLAVERCVMGGYANSGQVCISVQRIYIHESVYDVFERRFAEKVSNLKTGDQMLEETFVGPLITPGEVKRVHEQIEGAKTVGGEVLTGGFHEGNVYMPTVLKNVPETDPCCREEIFAPVTLLFPYQNFDDALNRVNDSVYGLQAGVFTKDIEKAMKAFNRLEVGGVIINDIPTFRVDSAPYGGTKLSGLGREGVRYAIEEMTEIKIMIVKN